jgi:pimeloyl-ACP methyl ester carboxylesterase
MRIQSSRTLICAVLLALSTTLLPAQSLLKSASELPAQKSIPVFGQKIVYYDAGTGPVVVLVHGFGSQARFDWGNVINQLAEHHRVIALDQIGFGSSDKPFIDYSVQTYVDFLGEFLRTLKVDRFTLAGESLGGWISALYTIEALDKSNTGPYALPVPTKLILEDAAGVVSIKDALSHIAVPGTLADVRGVAIVFHDKSRVTDDFVRENFALQLKANDGFTKRSFANNPKTDSEVVADRIKTITIPTLVIWGGDDELIPIAQGRAYAAGIPGAKFVVIPECGHGPSVEKPADFIAAAIPFIDSK